MGRRDRPWQTSLRHQQMKAFGRLLGRFAKGRGKFHIHPAMACVIKQRPLRNGDPVLFLQAHRLRTQLNLIGQPWTCRSSLELDGERNFGFSAFSAIFHRVGDATDAKAVRNQRHRSYDAHATSMILAGLIDAAMHDCSLHRGDVLFPYSLDVD